MALNLTGTHKFADWSQEEFDRRNGGRQIPVHSSPSGSQKEFLSRNRLSSATNFDWRDEPGVVTAIKNQGSCGSCWCFGPIAVVESANAIAGVDVVQYSEQQALDCVPPNGDYNNCPKGGYAGDTLTYVSDNGIQSQASYPYEMAQETCRYNSSRVETFISNWEMWQDPTTQSMIDMITEAPVVTILAAGDGFSGYTGGIMGSEACVGTDANHFIAFIGWGHDTASNTDYWIGKNSWGTTWGEDGFFRMERGNICQSQYQVYSVSIDSECDSGECCNGVYNYPEYYPCSGGLTCTDDGTCAATTYTVSVVLLCVIVALWATVF
ncbi:Cysteine proteinase Cathepsin L [Pelomyxa schiedti]|nr:Cysteine proteinase Cathepsin L [Pelomyxa schiedti]